MALQRRRWSSTEFVDLETTQPIKDNALREFVVRSYENALDHGRDVIRSMGSAKVNFWDKRNSEIEFLENEIDFIYGHFMKLKADLENTGSYKVRSEFVVSGSYVNECWISLEPIFRLTRKFY